MIRELLLDCDGVLANFILGSCRVHQRPYPGGVVSHRNYHHDWGLTDAEFWEKCSGTDFWLQLELCAGAKELVHGLRDMAPVTILTATPRDHTAHSAKVQWLNKHFGIPTEDIIVGSKKHLLANPAHLLIDDYHYNVSMFRKHGGHAIRYPANANDDPQLYRQVLRQVRQIMKSEESNP